MKYLKIAVFVINILIWFTGCMVLVFGAWLLLEPSNEHILNLFLENKTPHDSVYLVACILLGIGATVLVVSLFGCQASIRGNHCILAVYLSLLILLIASELASVGVASFITFRTMSNLEGRLRTRLPEYGHELTNDVAFTQSLDFAQYRFNCCGIYGHGDYNDTPWWRDGQFSGTRRNVPLTCCVLKNPEVKNAGSPMSVVSRVFHKDNEKPWLYPQPRDEVACQATDPQAQEGYRHHEGCFEKVTNWFKTEGLKLVFAAAALAGVQIFGVISSALLCRRLRDMQED